jgi:hypothetical protein
MNNVCYTGSGFTDPRRDVGKIQLLQLSVTRPIEIYNPVIYKQKLNLRRMYPVVDEGAGLARDDVDLDSAVDYGHGLRGNDIKNSFKRKAPPLFIDPPFIDPPFIDCSFIDPSFIDPPFIDPPFIDQLMGRILQHRPPIDRPLQLIDQQIAAIFSKFRQFWSRNFFEIPAILVPQFFRNSGNSGPDLFTSGLFLGLKLGLG